MIESNLTLNRLNTPLLLRNKATEETHQIIWKQRGFDTTTQTYEYYFETVGIDQLSPGDAKTANKEPESFIINSTESSFAITAQLSKSKAKIQFEFVDSYVDTRELNIDVAVQFYNPNFLLFLGKTNHTEQELRTFFELNFNPLLKFANKVCTWGASESPDLSERRFLALVNCGSNLIEWPLKLRLNEKLITISGEKVKTQSFLDPLDTWLHFFKAFSSGDLKNKSDCLQSIHLNCQHDLNATLAFGKDTATDNERPEIVIFCQHFTTARTVLSHLSLTNLIDSVTAIFVQKLEPAIFKMEDLFSQLGHQEISVYQTKLPSIEVALFTKKQESLNDLIFLNADMWSTDELEQLDSFLNTPSEVVRKSKTISSHQSFESLMGASAVASNANWLASYSISTTPPLIAIPKNLIPAETKRLTEICHLPQLFDNFVKAQTQ